MSMSRRRTCPSSRRTSTCPGTGSRSPSEALFPPRRGTRGRGHAVRVTPIPRGGPRGLGGLVPEGEATGALVRKAGHRLEGLPQESLVLGLEPEHGTAEPWRSSIVVSWRRHRGPPARTRNITLLPNGTQLHSIGLGEATWPGADPGPHRTRKYSVPRAFGTLGPETGKELRPPGTPLRSAGADGMGSPGSVPTSDAPEAPRDRGSMEYTTSERNAASPGTIPGGSGGGPDASDRGPGGLYGSWTLGWGPGATGNGPRPPPTGSGRIRTGCRRHGPGRGQIRRGPRSTGPGPGGPGRGPDRSREGPGGPGATSAGPKRCRNALHGVPTGRERCAEGPTGVAGTGTDWGEVLHLEGCAKTRSVQKRKPSAPIYPGTAPTWRGSRQGRPRSERTGPDPHSR